MRNPRRTTLLTVGSALLAVAPKCPVCFLAYFGIFGVATASASAYRVWLPWITAIWLALTVATLFIRTNGWRRYGPVAVAIIGALSIFIAKFVVPSTPILYAGIVVLVATVLWSSWLRTAASQCSQCEHGPRLTDDERGLQAELPTQARTN